MQRGVLRNFTKFTGKYLCQSLFFDIVAGLRPATLLKKILRTAFLQSTSGRLLLIIVSICYCMLPPGDSTLRN